MKGCPADVRMIAWIRRRSGPDSDFGAVFEEIFGSRRPITEDRFGKVLRERGVDFDIGAAFNRVRCYGSANGAVGAAEFEMWQNEIEERENEGVKILRDFLKLHFTSPSEAFKTMGKGEGEVITQEEFGKALEKVGFKNADPDDLFRCIDKDFSGEISFAEFRTVMRSAGTRKPSSASAAQDDGPKLTRNESSEKKKRSTSSPRSQSPSRKGKK